jgi:glycosyltransferase involved in cell wall biosynthesis
MTTRALVSVLTPVHNGAKYLAESIESVRRQTYREFEYIILDNKSTDDTARIAEESAAQDARIRVLRPDEFVGIWSNHNRGLRAIAPGSRYVKIVHADDWLYPECLERMVEVAEANPEVGVVSAFRLEGDWVLHDGLLPYTKQVMHGRELIRRALLGPPWATGSPTSLLFRADFVRATPEFFDESVWHADTDAAYRVLMQSDFGFVHQVLTFTRLHPGALTPLSHRANTFLPQELRMNLRYGSAVFSRKEHRKALREWLRAYLWYLAKQAVKLSRRGDHAFHSFHRREIDLLLREIGDDRAGRLALRLCRAIVRDGADVARGVAPGSVLEISRSMQLKGADPRE